MGRRRDECEALRAERDALRERLAEVEEAARRTGRTMAGHVEQRHAAEGRARELGQAVARVERRLGRMARACARLRAAESAEVWALRVQLRQSEDARAALEQQIASMQNVNEVLCRAKYEQHFSDTSRSVA